MKKQEIYEKSHFSGFFSVSFMRFLFSISIFRRIFLGGNRKTHYLCNRKNKVRGFKPELPIKPQSCQEASKNNGVDDKDVDDEKKSK